MLDFYFGEDPLAELERLYQKTLEEALGINREREEDCYLKKMEAAERIRQQIDQLLRESTDRDT